MMRCFLNCCLGVLAVFSLLLSTGCAPQIKPLPPSSLNDEHEMCLQIGYVSETPTLMTSGSGGLIGAMINAGRGSELNEKMQGIDGNSFKELIQENISNRLEDYFEMVDPDEKPEFVSDVRIGHWGWFLPTGAFGIKTGVYSFRIFGEVNVKRADAPEDAECIGYCRCVANQPIGNDPTSEQIRKAMISCTDLFSKEAVRLLITQKKVQQ